MRRIAGVLNAVTGGKLSPNAISIIGFLAHIPIAYLIGGGHLVLAALLIIVFGLFDALDGELARLQNKTSAIGMFLDSSSDRLKEIVLYCGMVYAILATAHTRLAIFVLVGALGVSLLTSYLNAWGEVVLAHFGHTKNHQTNQTFRSGFLGFETRMFLIVVGLLFDKLLLVLCIIFVLGIITVWQRFTNIVWRLKNV